MVYIALKLTAMTKYLFALHAALIAALGAPAQPNPDIFQGATVEIHAIHDGQDIPELEGFITYRVYAQTDPGHFLSAIFGNSDPGALVGPTGPLSFTLLDGEMFQSPFGGFTPSNCVMADFIASLAYDSWLTIGEDCDSGQGTYFLLSLFSNPSDFPLQFEALTSPGSVALTQGGITAVQDFSNGWVGEEGRILLAQFTTSGDWEFCFSLQGQMEGLPNASGEFWTWGAIDVCVSSEDAVLPPSGMILAADNQFDCMGGGEATIYLQSMEWFVPLISPEFKLMYAPDLNQNFEVVASSLESAFFTVNQPGIYKLELESAVFQYQDESPVIEISAPAVFDAMVNSQLMEPCSGSDSALNVLTSGGVSPFEYSLDGVVFQSDTSFNNVPCGDWSVVIVDASGCTIEVLGYDACPEYADSEILTTDETLLGLSDGSAFIIVTAPQIGIPLTVEIQGPGFEEVFMGESPLEIYLTDLAPGDYAFNFDDGVCMFGNQFFIGAGPVSVSESAIHGLSAFPNPFNGSVNLMVPTNALLILTDINGRTVFTQRVQTGMNVIDLSGLSVGVYSALIQSSEFELAIKLVKSFD
jgi:hypothetical protein